MAVMAKYIIYTYFLQSIHYTKFAYICAFIVHNNYCDNIIVSCALAFYHVYVEDMWKQ